MGFTCPYFGVYLASSAGGVYRFSFAEAESVSSGACASYSDYYGAGVSTFSIYITFLCLLEDSQFDLYQPTTLPTHEDCSSKWLVWKPLNVLSA